MTDEEKRVYYLSQTPTELALLRAWIEVTEQNMGSAPGSLGPEIGEDGVTSSERRICEELKCDPADFIRLRKTARRTSMRNK